MSSLSSDKYLFKQSKEEFQRLNFQGDILLPHLILTLKDLGKEVVLKGMRFVDFGCGTGSAYEPVKKYIGNQGTYVGIDKSDEQINYARNCYPGRQYIMGDENDIEVIKSKRQFIGHLLKLKKSVIVFFRITGEYYEHQRLSFSKYW